MNIPRFLQLYKEDRLEEAFESVVLDNPLPASTGNTYTTGYCLPA